MLEEVLNSTAGVGILGMMERAEILGGHLSVVSAPKGGTEVILEVPLETE